MFPPHKNNKKHEKKLYHVEKCASTEMLYFDKVHLFVENKRIIAKRYIDKTLSLN